MNRDKHIRSAFDRDLETIQAHVLKMGGLVEAAIPTRAARWRPATRSWPKRSAAGDQAIDALEAQVKRGAARLIALRAPMATDLRMVLAVIKISASLERVGDYAKNIAKRTSVLAQMPPSKAPAWRCAGCRTRSRRCCRTRSTPLSAAMPALAEDVRQRD